jgi:hypothetical protein
VIRFNLTVFRSGGTISPWAIRRLYSSARRQRVSIGSSASSPPARNITRGEPLQFGMIKP